MTDIPTTDELQKFSLRAFRGIDAGIGQTDPTAEIARKLESANPGHLILIQAGKFLHGFDRTAYVLSTLKNYKLKLVGTTDAPHLRVGFPVSNFKRRLWPMVAEFGIPYVVALGSQAAGHTVYESSHGDASVIGAVSIDVINEVITDLKQRGELNKAAAKQLLASPDTSGFKMKSQAQDLDTQILQDIIKLPRDLRCTYGENLRACMARIIHAIFAFGLEENKPALLRSLSADVDCLKHYLTQAQRLNLHKSFSFEHRVGLAVELGKLVGGLIKSHQVQP